MMRKLLIGSIDRLVAKIQTCARERTRPTSIDVSFQRANLDFLRLDTKGWRWIVELDLLANCERLAAHIRFAVFDLVDAA